MGTSSHFNISNQKAQIFYSDLSSINPNEKLDKYNTELSEKIQLKISINQIQKGYTYKVRLLNINEYNQKIILKEYTECICQDNITANLDLPIIIRYFFEKEQPLIVEILKIKSDEIKTFQINTTLGCIMGSRKNTYHVNISTPEREILIIQGEKLKQSEEVIKIAFDIKSKKKFHLKI